MTTRVFIKSRSSAADGVPPVAAAVAGGEDFSGDGGAVAGSCLGFVGDHPDATSAAAAALPPTAAAAAASGASASAAPAVGIGMSMARKRRANADLAVGSAPSLAYCA